MGFDPRTVQPVASRHTAYGTAADCLTLPNEIMAVWFTNLTKHVIKDSPGRPYIYIAGPGSSVGVVTDYGLDGPGWNPSGDDILRLSRPVMGPTQPPVQWVPGLSRG